MGTEMKNEVPLTIQSQSPHAGAGGINVAGNGFINPSKFEKKEYNDNMEPWVGNEHNFLFAAHSFETITNQNKEQEVSIDISIYHPKGNPALIVKTRKCKPGVDNGSLLPIGIGLLVVGVLLALVLIITDQYQGAIAAIAPVILGVIFIWASKKDDGAKFSITVRTIPINLIKCVSRKDNTVEDCCGGCGSNSNENDIEYSVIVIMYGGETTALNLFSNHAYSLFQYLNGVLDEKKSKKNECKCA